MIHSAITFPLNYWINYSGIHSFNTTGPRVNTTMPVAKFPFVNALQGQKQQDIISSTKDQWCGVLHQGEPSANLSPSPTTRLPHTTRPHRRWKATPRFESVPPTPNSQSESITNVGFNLGVKMPCRKVFERHPTTRPGRTEPVREGRDSRNEAMGHRRDEYLPGLTQAASRGWFGLVFPEPGLS